MPNARYSSLLVLAVLYGCGTPTHHAAAPPPMAPLPPAPPPEFAPRGPSTAPAYDPTRARASAESGARDDRAELPASSAAPARPGLGTEWGENRDSRLSFVSFERQSYSRPVAITSLHYNDRDGIRALTRHGAIAAYSSAAPAAPLSVRLLDASGTPLPAFALGSRTYVMGDHGERYVLQIQNHTGARVEAVATVDGLDVIDGRAGSFEKRGYIIEPWSSLEIEGFRRSVSEVAAFRFGSVQNSYAASKGAERNVGVVGVAFFTERGAGPMPWLEEEAQRRHQADPFPGRFAAPPHH